MARRRLDAELVRRGLARSREHAQQLVEEGRVRVGGAIAAKSATQVEDSAAVEVVAAASGPDYASRGAHKLIGALAACGQPDIDLTGEGARRTGAMPSRARTADDGGVIALAAAGDLSRPAPVKQQQEPTPSGAGS